MALGAGSAALAAVPGAAAGTDQRGVVRTAGAPSDIGAYERVPPVVSVAGASVLTQVSAALAGTVENESLGAGTAHFEYGPASDPTGSSTVTVAVPAQSTRALTANLTGLAAGTTYHFRLVGTNADGTTTAAGTFTTPPTGAAAPITHVLTILIGGAGTGTVSGGATPCSVDCVSSYTDGTSITLRAAPTSRSSFAGWAGDCTGLGICTLTLGQDHTVSAVFSPAPGAIPPLDCVVPALKGMSLAKARAILRAAGCRLGKVRQTRSSSVKRGRIVSQTQGAYRIRPAGTTVGVTVSRGR
jgi:PASTA domain/Divergent InlB B-repeat domain